MGGGMTCWRRNTARTTAKMGTHKNQPPSALLIEMLVYNYPHTAGEKSAPPFK
jgi:hypothetical protein